MRNYRVCDSVEAYGLEKALDKASEDLSMSGNGKRDTAAAFADYIIKIMGE